MGVGCFILRRQQSHYTPCLVLISTCPCLALAENVLAARLVEGAPDVGLRPPTEGGNTTVVSHYVATATDREAKDIGMIQLGQAFARRCGNTSCWRMLTALTSMPQA